MRIYDTKGNPKSNHRRGDTTYLDEIGATATVATTVGYLASQLSLLPHVREMLYNARHAGKTISDAVKGGPEGMRAAKSLDEAITIVETARGDNIEAANTLETYLVARKDLVGKLVLTYRENETFGREAERLKLQVEGSLKNLFEIGNDLKPNSWKKNVDSWVIKLYGQDPIIAAEKSERVRKFYEEARKFYDAREKNEHVVKEFCNYLENVKTESETQNNHFNELFPEIIGRVKEGYETEDIVFAQRRAKDFSKERNADTSQHVKDFRRDVDTTYEEVRQEMPIREYSDTNWVDVITHPMTIGLAVAMIGYSASRLALPRIIRNPITKALALPITLPVRGLHALGKRGIQTLKRRKIAKNIGESQK